MADETKTLENLIAENRQISTSIDDQVQESKKISSELKEVGHVIKGDLKSVIDTVTSPLENAKDQGVGQLRQQEELKETQAKQTKTQEKQTILLEEVVNGILDLKDSLLKSLKSGIGKGLGAIAALILAPIILLADFFGQLGTEIKFLNKLTGGRLAKLFKPIVNIFDAISDIVKVAGTSNIPKGNTFKVFGKFTQGILKIVATVKSILKPIMEGGKKLSGFMKGFKPIVSFVGKIGRFFGKIFLPISFLMSVFDFVTGFMDGYDEGGILGGLEGGLSKLFANLIGMPLDLLKSAISWIAGVFGFDGVSEALDSFSFSDLITDMIGGIFDGVSGIFTFLGDLFAIEDLTLFEGFLKLVDLVLLPLNLAINFVKGIFGFGDPEKPFSISEFITDTVNGIFEWIKSLFTFDFSSIGENISSIGTVMSGLAAGGKAAIAAMLPGGESPGEAFNKAYSNVLNGGSGNNRAAQLDQAEIGRKTAEEDKQQASQQSRIVANSGNTSISNNSSSTTNMVSQGMPDVSQLNNFNMDEALAMG